MYWVFVEEFDNMIGEVTVNIVASIISILILTQFVCISSWVYRKGFFSSCMEWLITINNENRVEKAYLEMYRKVSTDRWCLVSELLKLSKR